MQGRSIASIRSYLGVNMGYGEKWAVIQLSGCSGCPLAVLSSPLLQDFMYSVSVVYFPMVNDSQRALSADIAIVTGAVCRESEEELLRRAREGCSKLIALGTCAAYGGLVGWESEGTKAIPEIVEVEQLIPGCPPPEKLIGEFLVAEVSGGKFKLPEYNVCKECPRAPLRRRPPIRVRYLDPPEGLQANTCFLDYETMCLGPITRGGCDAVCIKLGVPCQGCLGPPAKSYTSQLADFLSILDIHLDKSRLKQFASRYIRVGAHEHQGS